MISKTIKQIQNLYSWNEFYQSTGNKEQMKKCQSEIHRLKRVINELKTKKNASPLMPINFTFTVHGVSGIRRGDMFKVNGIPTIYENGFFQVLSVKHMLEGMSWKTEVTGGYRNNK